MATGSLDAFFRLTKSEVEAMRLPSAFHWQEFYHSKTVFKPALFPRRRPDHKVELPEEPVLCSAAQDLLRRLLEVNPRYRLKSVLALEKIAFYQHFNFADIRAKKPIQAYKDLFR
nr:PREDICTED: serine/threonine-protein kinase S6KL-like [Bemisia tabaci]